MSVQCDNLGQRYDLRNSLEIGLVELMRLSRDILDNVDNLKSVIKNEDGDLRMMVYL